MTLARDPIRMITAAVAQIDHLISIQLNEILHHPQFQNLRYLAGTQISSGPVRKPARN